MSSRWCHKDSLMLSWDSLTSLTSRLPMDSQTKGREVILVVEASSRKDKLFLQLQEWISNTDTKPSCNHSNNKLNYKFKRIKRRSSFAWSSNKCFGNRCSSRLWCRIKVRTCVRAQPISRSSHKMLQVSKAKRLNYKINTHKWCNSSNSSREITLREEVTATGKAISSNSCNFVINRPDPVKPTKTRRVTEKLLTEQLSASLFARYHKVTEALRCHNKPNNSGRIDKIEQDRMRTEKMLNGLLDLHARLILGEKRWFLTSMRHWYTHNSNLSRMRISFFQLRLKGKFVRSTSWSDLESHAFLSEWPNITSWWSSQQVSPSMLSL